jgi:hypothetical protein
MQKMINKKDIYHIENEYKRNKNNKKWAILHISKITKINKIIHKYKWI